MYAFVGQNFIDMIKSIVPMAKVASGGREVVIRCPFCGDSSNQRHAHFYISVPRLQEDLSFYHCKRCPNHGIVDDDLLRKIGCNDSNVIIELMRHNTEVLKLPKYKSLKKINIYPLNNSYIRDDPNNTKKLEYINNRIGANYSYGDLIRLKIFLNLYDIIGSNNLELTRHEMVCNDLDRYFIGFISYDNSYCGMRKITDQELYKTVNKRYINYSLFNKVEDNKNFYVIPTNVDVLDPTVVKIHIAEGQFDILSIFHNLNHDNRYQNIYIAAGGKSYTQALEFILSETGIINYEIHYYPDNDVGNQFDFTTNKIASLPVMVFIHKNLYPGEKDYGVPANRIRDTIISSFGGII